MYKIPANNGFASNSVHYLPTCHSTNEIAANMLGQDFEEGTIVITDNQTAGKGQRGNTWETKPYLNLTFSLLLKPGFLALQKQFQLTQVVSISLANVVQEYVSGSVKIKWPNDIYVGDKKIAGILIQNSVKGKSFENSIIGIGLNVNQEEFINQDATSLKIASGRKYELNDLLVTLHATIAQTYDALKNGEHRKLNEEYHQLLYARNQIRTFDGGKRFSGEIIGTDQLGRLLIQTNEGVKCYQNQEIKLVRG